MLPPAIAEGLAQLTREAREEGYRAGLAEAGGAEREEGYRDGYAQGRADASATWQARLRALLGDGPDTTAGTADAAASERPPPKAGDDPVLAADGEAGGNAGAATAAPSCEAPAPEPMGAPSNTGGEPSAPPEPQPAAPPSRLAMAVEKTFGVVQAKPALRIVEPAAPAPGAHEPEPGGEPWQTKARRAVLEEHFPDGVPVSEIRAMLEALPGPALPAAAVTKWARQLNLERLDVEAPAERAPKVERIKRACLSCDRSFMAEGRFERLCSACRKRSEGIA